MNPSLKLCLPWYRGLKLRQWLESEEYGELNGHELDEIIDESLTIISFHGAELLDWLSFWASIKRR
jgi:hypothetical protein